MYVEIRRAQENLREESLGQSRASRRDFLLTGASMAASLVGCSFNSSSSSQSAAEPEQELAPFIRCERAILQLGVKGIATVEHINPDQPIHNPAFVVGWHHYQPAGNSPTQLAQLEYFALEVLVQHGFTFIAVDGHLANEKLLRHVFTTPSKDGVPGREYAPSELREKLTNPKYFAQFVEMAHANSDDPVAAVLPAAFADLAVVTGMENPAGFEERKQHVIEDWHSRSVKTVQILELYESGQKLEFPRVEGKLTGEVKLGPETFYLQEVKNNLKRHAEQHAANEPFNREREQFALGLNQEVYLMGIDHLDFLKRQKFDRSVFLVRVTGSVAYEEGCRRSRQLARTLLAEITMMEEISNDSNSQKE